MSIKISKKFAMICILSLFVLLIVATFLSKSEGNVNKKSKIGAIAIDSKKENINVIKNEISFNDFPPEFFLQNPSSKLNFKSNSLGSTFGTVIEDAYKNGPNFAGHYTVIEWGCGTSCQDHALIDNSTGEIHNFNISSAFGIEYKLESRLIIVNPPQNIPENFEKKNEDPYQTRFYEFFEKDFSFKQLKDITKDDISWEGEWATEDSPWVNGDLSIKNVNDKTFEFTLNVNYGGNTGAVGDKDINGQIAIAKIINDNEAVYEKKVDSFMPNVEDGGICKLSFLKKSNNLQIFSSQSCLAFAGEGVYFDFDNFVKNGKTREASIDDVTILNTDDKKEAFKQLVGNDLKIFEESAMIESEADDLDSFSANVSSYAVAHLYEIKESIIMIDTKNRIWAAVIDDNKIKYFTNVQDWKRKLPSTIKNWANDFYFKNNIEYKQ